MKEKANLIRVYTGTDVLVNLLKDELENTGISCMIQNDFNSGISAGFSGGLSSGIDLFIQEFDMMKAEPIINEFVKINN
jgi:hypothetical protein